MFDNRLWQALLPALAMGLTAVSADERSPVAGSASSRSYAPRPVQAAAVVKVRSQEAKPVPVRPAPIHTVQLDSHGRYPFGQFRGGYRYPFSYPYYRYGGSRHYPYSFGVGPYGPYGSNYGGYSGNAFDPQIYGRPLPNGPSLPDAPPAAPPADAVPPGNGTSPVDRAPHVDRTPLPNAPRSDPAEAGVLPSPGQSSPNLHVPPAAIGSQEYGRPPIHFGGNPLGLIYGGVPAFGPYPFGYYNNPLFGQNPFIGGFGMYPPQIYSDAYGPPSGPGFYRPAYVPQYSGFSGRNYGPTYPAVGGINLGPGYYGGW